MTKEIELWQFITSRLKEGGAVRLLVVAASSGSSPGRAGYKMAVTAKGHLFGSIGGGVMEVGLVEQAKVKSKKAKGKLLCEIIEQVHRKNAPNASGMICSGRQTVILRLLTPDDMPTVGSIIQAIENDASASITITQNSFEVGPTKVGAQNTTFERQTEAEFEYNEKIGFKNRLYIIGGGHCAFALSELMSRMNFYISIYDDRPELNTIDKNRFAHEIAIIESYETIGQFVDSGPDEYVVVMTLGYKSDEQVIRALFDKDLKYFGVLGSKAKMKTLLTTLEKEGYAKERLSLIHTPIGLPIKSRTPEEIAVSIAAEIISIKNS